MNDANSGQEQSDCVISLSLAPNSTDELSLPVTWSRGFVFNLDACYKYDDRTAFCVILNQ